MSMTTNESTSLTNQLNGYNEAGSNSNNYTGSTSGSSSSKTSKKRTTTKKTTTKATKATTAKAPADTSYYFKGTGTAQPVTVATVSKPDPVPDYHQDINNVNLFDYLLWPVVIFIVLLVALYNMFKSYAKKHPAHGGFAHKHKRRHPGVPNPRIFK